MAEIGLRGSAVRDPGQRESSAGATFDPLSHHVILLPVPHGLDQRHLDRLVEHLPRGIAARALVEVP